ncbi:MAG: hypothetical protein BGO26_10240 [Actinobacteria bacterium 69-20]|nr:hypothetical protein [Actinomycetota bacterium]OJV23277.1 MAG: hypothetical protein BGO26_10240 [Actinobacteria bacterium 69-20]
MTSVSDAAAAGGGLPMLVAMRAALAAAVDDCESMRDLPALTRQLDAVDQRIASLTVAEPKGDGVDEIAERRASRREHAAKGAARARASS